MKKSYKNANKHKHYLRKHNSFRKLNNRHLYEDAPGRLEITVYHEDFSEPLPYAIVRISKVSISGEYNEIGKGQLLYIYYTDENGKIPVVELPPLHELIPNSFDYYVVAVHHFSHYSAYIFYIQIYPNVTTKYEVSLNNITSDEVHFEFILQPRTSDIK